LHEPIICQHVSSNTLHLLPLVKQTGRDEQRGKKVEKEVSHFEVFLFNLNLSVGLK
jgi:hypothetical protein